MNKLKYGEAFKELQKLSNTTFSDLKAVMSRDGLAKFISGKTMIGFERLNSALEIMGFTMEDYASLINGEIEKEFGQKFHDIRYQRGYRKDYFESVGVSTLRLQLFETGRIMLPYNTLNAMLLLMNVPESDFGYMLNGEQDDYFISIIEDLDLAFLKGDINQLKYIENETAKVSANIESPKCFPDSDKEYDYAEGRLTRQFTDFRILELTAKGGYIELSESELTEIGDFLMGVDLWLEYDFGILALNAHHIHYNLLHGILSEIRKQIWVYKSKFVYRRRIVQAGLRGALTLISEGNLEKAEKLLTLVKDFCFVIDIQNQGLFRFTQAYLSWKLGKEEEKQNMIKVIEYLDFIGEMVARDYCKNFYDIYVLENNTKSAVRTTFKTNIAHKRES